MISGIYDHCLAVWCITGRLSVWLMARSSDHLTIVCRPVVCKWLAGWTLTVQGCTCCSWLLAGLLVWWSWLNDMFALSVGIQTFLLGHYDWCDIIIITVFHVLVDRADPFCNAASKHVNNLLERFGAPLVILNLVKVCNYMYDVCIVFLCVQILYVSFPFKVRIQQGPQNRENPNLIYHTKSIFWSNHMYALLERLEFLVLPSPFEQENGVLLIKNCKLFFLREEKERDMSRSWVRSFSQLLSTSISSYQ